jgi:hypothetical protein
MIVSHCAHADGEGAGASEGWAGKIPSQIPGKLLLNSGQHSARLFCHELLCHRKIQLRRMIDKLEAATARGCNGDAMFRAGLVRAICNYQEPARF